jgi:hypothetical protein
MTPATLNRLLVLGTASGGPIAMAELCGMARLITPNDWQPTLEALTTAVGQALSDALIVMIEDALHPSPAIETTPLGDEQLKALLREPIPLGRGGFTRACMSAKLCFLHLLPALERGGAAAELCALYHQAIAHVRRLRTRPEWAEGPAQQALRCELARLDSELAWAERLTGWSRLDRAAE